MSTKTIDEAQERAEKKGAEVLEVEPARGGGSYVLQKVKCGKPSCRCARPGGELHGPYWYHYWKMDRKTKSKYVGKIGLWRARETAKVEAIARNISARVVEDE